MSLGRRSAGVPPIIFGFLAAPGGVFYWGIGALLIPYLLRKQGVPVDRIAELVAIATLPTLWAFFVTPIIDLGPRRRDGVLLFSAVAAASAWLAIGNVRGSLLWLTVILFAGQIAQSLVGAAAGALMSCVPSDQRGRAGGWFQAGNVGGGSLTGGSLIWLADRIPLPVLAAVTAAVVMIPALAALLIVESPLPRLEVRPLFAALFRDLWELLSARRTWLGMMYFLSPASAGALGNLISSVGPDYRASGDVVAAVTGVGASVLMGLGCALGGWICDRVHRKTCYGLFGLGGAASAALLWLGPVTPWTYIIGYSAYAFAVGLGYACYSALILEVMGRRDRGAATGYSFLYCCGNVPVLYMTWLDGIGYRSGGARGLMMTDALAGGFASLALLLIARHAVRHWPHLTDAPEAAPAEA